MRGRPALVIAERYRLVSKLGQGGMGSVWLAHDQTLDRSVALKELALPHGDGSEEHAQLRARAWREAVAAARLQHSGIVRIYDVLREGEDPWIVMEYIAGRSLADLIEDSPASLTERYVAEIGLRVLDALCVAHAQGVLHRDVKPANILIGRTPDEVLLADFGIATIEGHNPITREGSVIGTVEYMAPERIEGGTAGRASDLWSLGATLYTAVQGHSPYYREKSVAVMAAILSDSKAPEPLTGAPRLRPVIDSLLVKDPEARMCADEAARLLGRIVAGSAPDRAGRPPSRPLPPRPDPIRREHRRPRSPEERVMEPAHRTPPPGNRHREPAKPDATAPDPSIRDRGDGGPSSPFAVMAADEPARAVMIMARMGPRAAGGVLDDMAAQTTAVSRVMSVMSTDYAARVLDYAQPRTTATVLPVLPPERSAGILALMARKPAAAAIGAMSARVGPAAAVIGAMRGSDAGRVLDNASAKVTARVVLRLPAEKAATVLVHMAARPAGAVVEAMSARAEPTARVVRAMPSAQAARSLSHVTPRTVATILSSVDASWATRVLAEMDQEVSIVVIRYLNERPDTDS